jgi:(E)-4-hydroxy-3-methyl-but-2-enyl pyrophosphate reductase
LKELGIQTIFDIPEHPQGIFIVRTHGATPETFSQLEKESCTVIDLTCPDVKFVQDKAKHLAEEGYRVVIIGKPSHPEVIGIKANADELAKKESIVISCPEEVELYASELKTDKKIGIVVQTTGLAENFKNILNLLASYSKELRVYNTICPATIFRQQSALELADEVDLMIVAGSKASANTLHLVEILSKKLRTLHIETHDDIDCYCDLIEKAYKIGLTAGASTPDFVIDKIIKRIGE